MRSLTDALLSMPLVVALRGISEGQAEDVARVLGEGGVTVLEVTVRTKDAAISPMDAAALRSIESLVRLAGAQMHVAAGTVMQVDDLPVLRDLGISVCFSPSYNPKVVDEASRIGMSFMPGIETTSEAMSAIAAGAKGLKIFPTFYYEPDGSITLRHSPGFIRYLSKFVSCPIVASGDLKAEDIPSAYMKSGVTALNIGSNFFQPGIGLNELAERTRRYASFAKAALES
jgi:2-dehydro-3-deoxyphosphogalactonate aldolase